MLINETLSLYLHITNSQTNLTTMKKKEMIAMILQEFDERWNEYMEMLDAFGIHDEGTRSAGTRAATLAQLIDKLQIK